MHCSTIDLDQTLYFYEHGPVRQMLEREFEMALLMGIHQGSIAVPYDEGVLLHDTLMPDIFSFFLSAIQWTPEEQEKHAFSSEHHETLQEEILRLLCLHLQ